MRSLLWSEFRMRRLWFLPLLACVIVPLLVGQPLTYWGISESMALVALAALFFGATAFAGELAMGVQDFLFSRPVSWKKVLAAKLIVGIGMIATSSLVSAVVFRVVCPAPYVPFLTLAHMAVGFGWAMVFMGVPYLAGAACSVVLPGTVGAVMTLLAAAVGFGTAISVLKALGWRHGEPGFMIPWIAGGLIAAVFVVKSGLTLSLAQRAKRYVVVWLIATACLTPVAAAIYNLPEALGPRLLSDYQFSPDLSHALVLTSLMDYAQSSPTGPEAHYYYWDISNDRRAEIRLQDGTRPTWLNNDTLAWYRVTRDQARAAAGGVVTSVRMDQNGQLVTRHLSLPLKTRPRFDLISPDGKLMPLADLGPDGSFEAYGFLDLDTMRVLSVHLNVPHAEHPGWRNNTEFAAIDNQGVCHTVQVRY